MKVFPLLYLLTKQRQLLYVRRKLQLGYPFLALIMTAYGTFRKFRVAWA